MMTKARKAPDGAKPTYETLEKRLKEAEESRNIVWVHVRRLEQQAEELRDENRSLRTTIETMSEAISDHVRKARSDRAEPIPF